MTAALLSVGTAAPPTRLTQQRIRDLFAGQAGIDRRAVRLIGAAFDHAAIDHRHSVVAELAGGEGLFLDADDRLRSPSTGARNEVYRREAPGLFAAAALDALRRARMSAAQVTHVITVSCTGFFAPGPDFRLVRDLGIPAGAERYHLGFMGCAAAFPGLRAAARICAAQPEAVVLVVCAELCSLHLRSSSDPDQIVASAVFADGAAAAVVAGAPARRDAAVLELGAFSTSITDDGESAMDWTVGDAGFEMILTAEVPRIVGREIRGVVRAALGGPAEPDDGRDDAARIAAVDAWAVHPGGRSILDRVQAGLGLTDAAMATSRAVLREFGNMSSATVLFILQRILADPALGDGARVVGLAFGPGLTVETAQFVRREAAA
nr:type III polyketide synthase [Microbacterium bovistercoris]